MYKILNKFENPKWVLVIFSYSAKINLFLYLYKNMLICGKLF